MARTVADAAALLTVMAAVDPRDEATSRRSDRSAVDYTRALDAAGLEGARIGVARQFFGFDDRVDAVMQEALEALRRSGAELIDPVNIATRGSFDDDELEVLLYEFKHGLNAYLASRGPQAPVKTLAEVIAFNEANRDREMPYFGQDLLVKSEARGPLTEKAYRNALANGRRRAGPEGIDAALTKHKVDALVAPTGGPAWLTDLVNGDHFRGGSSSPSAVAGYPSITVPAGLIFGLPVGLSFIGRAWSEPTLIRLAYAFEQATKARRPPAFKPTAV
jgi:amidase